MTQKCVDDFARNPPPRELGAQMLSERVCRQGKLGPRAQIRWRQWSELFPVQKEKPGRALAARQNLLQDTLAMCAVMRALHPREFTQIDNAAGVTLPATLVIH